MGDHVTPVGMGTVPANIDCYPAYSKGLDPGSAAWSGVVLQVEDGVHWFLPPTLATALGLRLLRAALAAEEREGNVTDLIGWNGEPDPQA